MFIPGSYEEVLQETRSDHRSVGSAWGLVAMMAFAWICVSALVYLT